MVFETNNVFLFIPNIIGYVRIFLALLSFYYMPTNYIAAATCYIVSVVLDALDGHAARHFNQSSKFGAMLDQLTDRCGTMGLLVTLCIFYPKYMLLFQMSMVIDVACHWIYLHSSILQGKASHKYIDLSGNPIMKIYYESKLVLGFMCMTNELFYAGLYTYHFTPGPAVAGYSVIKLLILTTMPFAVLKTIISLVHGYVACVNIANIDVVDREKMKKQ